MSQLIPIAGVAGVDLALQRGEDVVAGALLGRAALAHRLRKDLRADAVHLPRGAGGDLHVAGALQRPEHEERLRHARSPGEQAMVPQDHRPLVADAAQEALLLARLYGDALELVVGHLA